MRTYGLRTLYASNEDGVLSGDQTQKHIYRPAMHRPSLPQPPGLSSSYSPNECSSLNFERILVHDRVLRRDGWLVRSSCCCALPVSATVSIGNGTGQKDADEGDAARHRQSTGGGWLPSSKLAQGRRGGDQCGPIRLSLSNECNTRSAHGHPPLNHTKGWAGVRPPLALICVRCADRA